MESPTTCQLESDRRWTSEQIEAAESPFYPLCESGPLCPLLDDPELLFDFYVKGRQRQQVKRFLKTHRWEDRPKFGYAINDGVLTQALHSMCNSPDARRLLRVSHASLELHNAMWAWLDQTDNGLFKAVQQYAHQDEAGKYFMTPAELGTFLDDQLGQGRLESNVPLLYIGVAFAMLQPDSRTELLAEILQRFPEAASYLGLAPPCQDAIPQSPEPDQPAEPSSPAQKEVALMKSEPEESDSTAIVDVACWVSQVDQLVHDIEELRAESQRFAESAGELSDIGALDAFSDKGDISSRLASLDEQRSAILKRSSTFLSALVVSCDHALPSACELDRLRRQIRANPPGTIQELEFVVTSMRDKALALRSKAKAGRIEIAELKSEAAELADLLGITDPSPQNPAPDSPPCDTLAVLSAQKAVATELRRKVLAELIRRRDTVVAELEKMAKQYDLLAGNAAFKQCSDFYEDLRDRITAAEDIGDVIECENLLDELRAKCRSAEKSDIRKLAGRLQKEPEAFDVFLQLCRATIDQGVPEIAQLLFFVRQRVHVFEEIAEAPDEALSLLIESACATSGSRLPRETVWPTLCQSPWLLSIGHGDIESTDLHDRIIVALMAAALGGPGDEAAGILVRLGSAELNNQRFPKPMDTLLRAVIERREIRIATPKDLKDHRDERERLDESLTFEGGRYRHIQCGKAHHFARFETVHVFPALAEFWKKITEDLDAGRFSSAHKSVEGIDVHGWYADLQRSAEKPLEDHPHFTAKIQGFMASFVKRLQAYVSGHQKIWGGDDFVVEETELLGALKEWAGEQQARTAVAGLLEDAVCNHARENSQTTIFWDAIGLCPSIVLHCPHVILWLRAQREPAADREVEQMILADLHVERTSEDTIQFLESNSAWERLAALPESPGLVANPEWTAMQDRDAGDLAELRKEVQALDDSRLLATFDACVRAGRVAAARGILDQTKSIKAAIREEDLRVAIAFAEEQLGVLESVKDGAASANMRTDWRDTVCELAAKVEMQLRQIKRADNAEQAPTERQLRLGKAVQALKFVVEEESTDFDEVEHILNPGKDRPDPATRTEEARAQARAKFPDLHEAWESIAGSDVADVAETRRSWSRFVKDFAKACNLYHDEHDEQKRFTTIPSIKYPFSVYKTAFWRPQSEFLKRPLRLYLYRQKDVDTQALQRLETELCGEDAATWLHVVFAPQGYERISRYFKYDAVPRDFLLVDEDFLYRVTETEKHDVPVRQALHGAVTDLANSSPFVAQGYCHQSNNIYVGRKDILQKLLNTPQAMIWGGRRIGKTSVLHALENSLLRIKNYRVAYVYLDLEDAGDPDLSVAQKISTTLGLPVPATIPEFEKQVSGLRDNGVRLAFLIDEVDEYIKKSREVHGDRFPLATTLRQLVMDDAAKDTRLVYSGYHQLYYEAKLNRGKRRVGHPFINTGQEVPIRNLGPDDVRDLVNTGFEDMLDIRVSPDVPNLVFRRASGHPAFVQQFCRCLLDRVSRRRSVGAHVTVTADDVIAVYDASAPSESGEEPFIFYVNETLGYNLSHLGRAIMLAVCHFLGAQTESENEASFFSLQKVSKELDDWCDVVGVPAPEQKHFQQTVDLLVMTNMLTQNPQEHDSYRVTYPTYIDILRRLDKLGRTALEDSLQKYSEKERESGVLL